MNSTQDRLNAMWECVKLETRQAYLYQIGVPHRFIPALADARFATLPEATRNDLAPFLDTSTRKG